MGGKALAAAWVLGSLGEPVWVTGFAGGWIGERLERILTAQGANCRFVWVKGELRLCAYPLASCSPYGWYPNAMLVDFPKTLLEFDERFGNDAAVPGVPGSIAVAHGWLARLRTPPGQGVPPHRHGDRERLPTGPAAVARRASGCLPAEAMARRHPPRPGPGQAPPEVSGRVRVPLQPAQVSPRRHDLLPGSAGSANWPSPLPHARQPSEETQPVGAPGPKWTSTSST